MRFLADENIPGDAVTEIEAAGHDIVWVRIVAETVTTVRRDPFQYDPEHSDPFSESIMRQNQRAAVWTALQEG